jgi:hypothetical protein
VRWDAEPQNRVCRAESGFAAEMEGKLRCEFQPRSGGTAPQGEGLIPQLQTRLRPPLGAGRLLAGLATYDGTVARGDVPGNQEVTC